MDSGCVRGMNWETGVGLCILPCVKQIASGNLLYKHRELNSVLCDRSGRWEGRVQGGGNICKPMADSCLCMAERATTL